MLCVVYQHSSFFNITNRICAWCCIYFEFQQLNNDCYCYSFNPRRGKKKTINWVKRCAILIFINF